MYFLILLKQYLKLQKLPTCIIIEHAHRGIQGCHPKRQHHHDKTLHGGLLGIGSKKPHHHFTSDLFDTGDINRHGGVVEDRFIELYKPYFDKNMDLKTDLIIEVIASDGNTYIVPKDKYGKYPVESFYTVDDFWENAQNISDRITDASFHDVAVIYGIDEDTLKKFLAEKVNREAREAYQKIYESMSVDNPIRAYYHPNNASNYWDMLYRNLPIDEELYEKRGIKRKLLPHRLLEDAHDEAIKIARSSKPRSSGVKSVRFNPEEMEKFLRSSPEEQQVMMDRQRKIAAKRKGQATKELVT